MAGHAEQQYDEDDRLTISLLCWNVHRLNHESYEKILNYLHKSEADLCFLQEVTITETRTRCTRAFYNLLDEIDYNITCFQEAGSPRYAPWNFLMYNNRVFNVQRVDELRGPAADACRNLNHVCSRRVCIAILKCVGRYPLSGIIIASCHLPVHHGERTENATNLFARLDELRRITGYPVIVAGDFNCDIRPTTTTAGVDLKCFEVPAYDPTIHREMFSGKNHACIDFFAYKNCNDIDRSVRIKIYNVCAELLQPSDDALHLVSRKNDQFNFVQYEHFIRKENSKLHQIHHISDHDPITATLSIEINSTPSFELCSYHREKSFEQEPLISKYFKKLYSFPSLVIDSHNFSAKLKSGGSCINFKVKDTTSTVHTSLPYKVWKLEYSTNALNSVEYFVVLIQHMHTSLVEKIQLEVLFDELGKLLSSCAVLVVGHFNIYKFLQEDPNITGPFNVPHYNPTMHSLVYGGKDNDHISFFAYQNSSNENAVKISLSNVHAEMIASCPPNHLTTQNKEPCFNYYLCHEELAKIHTASPYDPLLATITIGVTPSFWILYSDIKCSKLDDMCQYFNGLNAKPDLCIFKGSPPSSYKATVQQLCYDYTTIDHGHQHVIAYDSTKFAYERFENHWNQLGIHIHIFRCRSVARNPRFIVATYMVQCSLEHSIKIRNVENFFQICSGLVDKYECPVYIAGKLYVDMYKETDLNKHGFDVPMYAPTMYNMIHRDCKCPNYFAYKNPTNGAAITVSDLVAEMIIPNPGLVTGLHNVNISKDFKQSSEDGTNLEALRATMRIEA